MTTGTVSNPTEPITFSPLKKLNLKPAPIASPKESSHADWLTKTVLGVTLLIGALALNFPTTSKVWAEGFAQVNIDQTLQPIKTVSLFNKKTFTQTEIIAKQTTYKDDPNTEAGTDTIIDIGSDGKLTKTIEITYYKGTELGRDVIKTETIPAQDEVILRGTKIVWKNLDTPDGPIRYWKKIRVWATDYDSHCPGCDQWTATGMRQGKGVIAVDPTVIRLRSSVYIPGYGKAIAGDTGGAIKGNKIDLGFEDARTSGWSSRYVDIYLM